MSNKPDEIKDRREWHECPLCHDYSAKITMEDIHVNHNSSVEQDAQYVLWCTPRLHCYDCKIMFIGDPIKIDISNLLYDCCDAFVRGLPK